MFNFLKEKPVEIPQDVVDNNVNKILSYVDTLESSVWQVRQYQEQLSESKKLWEATVNSIEECLAILDANGKIIQINKSLRNELNKGLEELKGKTICETFCENVDCAIVDSACVTRCSRRILRSRNKYFEIYVNPIIDQYAGRLYGCVFVAKDVTLVRQANLQTSYIASIVQSSEDAIIGKTLDGIITSWNHGAEVLYGYKANEAIGKHINTIVPENLKNEVEILLHKVRHGDSIKHFRTKRLTKTGNVVDVSLTISPIMDNDFIVGASTIAHDITEQLLADREIERMASFPEMNPQPVLEVDLYGNVLYFNKATTKIISTVPAADIKAFIPPDFMDIVLAIKTSSQETFQREVEIGDMTFMENIYFAKQFNTLRVYATNITECRKKLGLHK